MIFVPNQLVGAPAGTNVTIDCHTEAYPRAMSYWFLGDEMILSNEKYTTSIMENSYRAYMRLTIRNLQAGDFGNYRCISKNSLGETEGSIRLYGKMNHLWIMKGAIKKIYDELIKEQIEILAFFLNLKFKFVSDGILFLRFKFLVKIEYRKYCNCSQQL